MQNMITQLTTVKARLAILDTDTQFDALLTNAIKAVGARFDKECSRTLARTENASQEFVASLTEICVGCYPIETITRFELKRSESEGWVAQPGVEYLVRQRCVLSLRVPLGGSPEQGRVIYTGGYVLPGNVPETGQATLPDDLEQAAIEQVAYWFSNRDRLGLLRIWDYHSTYRHFADLDLLAGVRAVLRKYARWNL